MPKADVRNIDLVGPYLDKLHEPLHDFLADCLPRICVGDPDWWPVMVRRSAVLRGGQKEKILSGRIKDFDELDLVTLLSLLKSHWPKICGHKDIDQDPEIPKNCKQLINARNHFSHKGLKDPYSRDDLKEVLQRISNLAVVLDVEVLHQDIRFELDKDDKDLRSNGNSLIAGGVEPSATSPLRPLPDQGIPMQFLMPSETKSEEYREILKGTTFVGIDFGTSTTVASCVDLAPDGRLVKESIPIPQEMSDGREMVSHLVPSCISFLEKKQKVIFGEGAVEASRFHNLCPGETTWTSFKMELGVDLGPKYYHSKLDGKDGRMEIRRPQDAAREFFRYIRKHIEQWCREQNRSGDIRYAVSVPAAFEANQRTDLCAILRQAGIEVEENSLIDEPNAAFIDFMMQALGQQGDGFLGQFSHGPKRALVFDFGAGTCDISILAVEVVDAKLVSKNLAISRFVPLGGDNIDRQIVRKILWPRIQKNCADGVEFKEIEFGQNILPKLQPVARELKETCAELLRARTMGGDIEPFRISEDAVVAQALAPIEFASMEGKPVEVCEDRPMLELREFFQVMQPFVAHDASAGAELDEISIFYPIQTALSKAKLSKEDLDLVIFIGGSAENVIVQKAVTKYFGSHVEFHIARSLRTPVSAGAALHSLAKNGLDAQFVHPITSETIFLVTKGDHLVPLIPAGTHMPSGEVTPVTNLEATGGSVVEIPICVSSRSKILHTLELSAPLGRDFRDGEPISVTASLDENKLLTIDAELSGVRVNARLANPIHNDRLSVEEQVRLQARRDLNESIVQNDGRPAPEAMKLYAQACADAEKHIEAAEAYDHLEKLDESYKTHSNAGAICFYYSIAGKDKLRADWAKEAYKRKPTNLTAYNVSLDLGSPQEAIDFLEDALDKKHSDDIFRKLVQYKLGDLLTSNSQTSGRREGKEYFRQSYDAFSRWVSAGKEISSNFAEEAAELADLFEDPFLGAAAERPEEEDVQEYQDGNLARAATIARIDRGEDDEE